MVSFSNQAEIVKKYREMRKISQSDLSVEMGIHPQAISNYERAKCGVPLRHIKKLQQFLSIPTHEIRSAIKKDFDQHLDGYIEKKSAEWVPPHLCSSEVIDGNM